MRRSTGIPPNLKDYRAGEGGNRLRDFESPNETVSYSIRQLVPWFGWSIMKNTWLSHFLKMAMGSLTRQEALTGFNNVTMINFNYDRAVEFFLFSKLQTDFD